MEGNGKREEGERGQANGGEGDRGGEHDEIIREESQSQKEGVQNQLEGQRVGKKEQEVITTEESENPINTIIKKTNIIADQGPLTKIGIISSFYVYIIFYV